jgi:hypothetical protein
MKHTDPPSRNAAAGHGAAHGQGPAHHYTPEELHNEDVAHEHSDISIRSVAMYATALAAIMATTFVLMYGVFWWWLAPQAAARDVPQSPLAAPAVQMPPDATLLPTFGTAPQPQLLISEPVVLDQQRQVEEQQLTGYGWVDEAGGVARIPIAEAKKLIVERGLPSRADGIADPTLGTVRPSRGEASGGRTVSGPPRGAGLPDVGGAAAPHQQQPPQKGGH